MQDPRLRRLQSEGFQCGEKIEKDDVLTFVSECIFLLVVGGAMKMVLFNIAPATALPSRTSRCMLLHHH